MTRARVLLADDHLLIAQARQVVRLSRDCEGDG
jgi:hypothetical protein